MRDFEKEVEIYEKHLNVNGHHNIIDNIQKEIDLMYNARDMQDELAANGVSSSVKAKIGDGKYALTNTNTQSVKNLKIKTPKTGELQGKMMLSIEDKTAANGLGGWNGYRGIAFLNADGTYRLWKSYKDNKEYQNIIECFLDFAENGSKSKYTAAGMTITTPSKVMF